MWRLRIYFCVWFCLKASAVANNRSFPKNFIFGASTASYQIEGAWNEDGKGLSIWDHLTHTVPKFVLDASNGDVAADTYHNYKRDVEMMRELGLDAYRFSISWTRILPTGFANQINPAGIEFYNNYINEILAYNITPMIALYHWDLPQKLQDLGGLSNPLFVEWFEDYARVVFDNFGDRVKLWITFNEPKQICLFGYGDIQLAPLVNATGVGEYICAKNLILANARAYHMYSNEFRAHQEGQVGYTVDIGWYESMTDSKIDKFSAELKRQSDWELYCDPIFSKVGGWPNEFSKRVAMKSKQQGFHRSRLPEFTEAEKRYVKGTADFLGVNHYYSYKVSATVNLRNYVVPSLFDDVNVGLYYPEDWPTMFGRMPQGPDSLNNVLRQLSKRYSNLTFYITESGFANSGGFEDNDRIKVYRNMIDSCLKALESGIDIKGFFAWSLMDNFEWLKGYTHRFGLYEVDFKDPARTRTPRKSAFVYKQIIRTRKVDHTYEPVDRVMTIDEGH